MTHILNYSMLIDFLASPRTKAITLQQNEVTKRNVPIQRDDGFIWIYSTSSGAPKLIREDLLEPLHKYKSIPKEITTPILQSVIRFNRELYKHLVSGEICVQTYVDMLVKYRETLLQQDEDIREDSIQYIDHLLQTLSRLPMMHSVLKHISIPEDAIYEPENYQYDTEAVQIDPQFEYKDKPTAYIDYWVHLRRLRIGFDYWDNLHLHNPIHRSKSRKMINQSKRIWKMHLAEKCKRDKEMSKVIKGQMGKLGYETFKIQNGLFITPAECD